MHTPTRKVLRLEMLEQKAGFLFIIHSLLCSISMQQVLFLQLLLEDIPMKLLFPAQSDVVPALPVSLQTSFHCDLQEHWPLKYPGQVQFRLQELNFGSQNLRMKFTYCTLSARYTQKEPFGNPRADGQAEMAIFQPQGKGFQL